MCDKYAKKAGNKMQEGLWNVVLDIDTTRLGKYLEDYLYGTRKMLEKVKHLGQVVCFADQPSILSGSHINSTKQILA